MRQTLFLVAISSLLMTGLPGCSKGTQNAGQEQDLPDWLADERGARDDRDFDPLAEDDLDLEYPEDKPVETPRRRRPPAEDARAKLALQLQSGDRFPLRKVISTELTQASLSGQPDVSRRQVELMMLIQVGEQLDDRTRLQVRYDRVRYQRDVAGEHVEYDSRQPPASIPFAVRMYHDMVQDGFSFWINQDNRIDRSDDFRTFLSRCLRNIPEDRRQQVLFEAEASTGENGITDFIDSSIGLLPSGYLRAGDSWERTRHVGRPVPMVVRNRYTLKELSDEVAIIAIDGVITPSTTLSEPDADSEIRISVTGGETSGTCTIFRDTGLPRESRVQAHVEMLVHAGEVAFTQQQRTVTTIESYPAQTASRTPVLSASHRVDSGDEDEEEDSPPPKRSPRRNAPRLK
ncbi:MAG: hypothetical protein KF774_08460 [Planctomyces sp.]|nr:hypothetical protein [Planctomyces sp.]